MERVRGADPPAEDACGGAPIGELADRGVRAGDIIREIAPIVGGKGGGKPDSAMGGGTDVLKIDDALAAVDDFVASHAKS